MAILELEETKNFIKKIKKIYKSEKNPSYEIIIAKNGKIVLYPTVSTRRKKILLLRDFNEDDIKEIKKLAKDLNIEVTELLNFWFDEEKDPARINT